MRPYLAIIKDSFREALASRILWVLTGCIVLLLVALAPLGYKLNLTGEFSWGDISDGRKLAAQLRQQGAADEPSPGRRIWPLFDDDTRTKLEKLEKADERGEGRDYMRGMDALRKGLNKLIPKDDLFSADDWQGISLSKEAKDLLARPRESLSKQELARLNRLLVESSYPGAFAWRSPTSLSLAYAWFTFDPLPFSKTQVDSFIKEWALTTVMGWIVGVFGMIAAILVTSSIIPQMFEPGSITLLLSKPVSRSLLLTAKFLGGCAFVLLNVTLLIVGLWLIVGLRFNIWNHGMLWCIPIFLFMFLIYYAVSSLTGLIWKSAIISVVVTVLFWILCFVVDLAYELVGGAVLAQERISRILAVDDVLLTVNEATRLQLWDDEAREWRSVTEPRGGPGIPTIEGPYYHEPSKQLLIGQGFRNPFGGREQRISLRVGSAADGWKLRDGPTFPSGTATFVVAHDNTIYAVAADNIFRFRGDPATKGASVNMFGLKLPILSGGEFKPAIEGDKPALADPIVAAADPEMPRVAVVAAGDIYLFDQQADGSLKQRASLNSDDKEKEGAAVAIAGNLVVVAREDGAVRLYSAEDLSLSEELSLEPDSQPRFVKASADGSRIAVLFQNRNLWLIDSATGDARRAPISAQGQVSGVAWTPDCLFVSDYANRVVAYDAETFARRSTFRPALSNAEIAFYYVIEPLYTIFPKPRMLNNTVQYMLTGKRTTDMGLFRGNLAQQREDLDPWKPVRSGLAFVAVVLLVACVYFERQEF